MIYQVQPLSYLFPDFVIHFSLGEKRNECVRINIEKICEIFEKTNFDPVFISSDGDSGSDSWHEEAFKNMKNCLEKKYAYFNLISTWKIKKMASFGFITFAKK
ncbi:hypothetical protein M9Y10_006666 [Tritrichomonas musculus]|uniref:Uncharacterized protein n=1 Tax=Tritrichomonas musculus TaxID=1915356 RepID=A0ABR2JES0_9EUKA